MRLYRKDLKAISAEFLRLLDEALVFGDEDLDRILLEKPTLQSPLGGNITFFKRPSNQKTMACTVSYAQQGVGIPLELKINPLQDYTQIILKCQKPIRGYAPFGMDPFNNIIQVKRIESCNFPISREELKNLSEMRQINNLSDT